MGDFNSSYQQTQKVFVKFNLASPILRIFAYVIDTMIKWLFIYISIIIFYIVIIGILLSGSSKQENEHPELYAIIVVIYISLIFLVYLLYHVIFEIILKGQTPGKKLLKIRVINEDGTFIGVVPILLRNIFRIIDFLPVFYCLGGILIFANKRKKRIGDMVAGTIVISEERVPIAEPVAEFSLPCFDNLEYGHQIFSEKAINVVLNYVKNKKNLSAAACLNIEKEIMAFIKNKSEIVKPENVSDTDFILALYNKMLRVKENI